MPSGTSSLRRFLQTSTPSISLFSFKSTVPVAKPNAFSNTYVFVWGDDLFRTPNTTAIELFSERAQERPEEDVHLTSR